MIVEGDGSRTMCQELAETIDLGSGRRLGSLHQPADPPSGNLACERTSDRFKLTVYDTGNARFGAIPCRYVAPPPYVGIVVKEVDRGLLLRAGANPNGTPAPAVFPGGPASKAGLKADDIITQIDDVPRPTTHDLDAIVAAHPIGDSLHLEVLRSGQTLSVDLVLEAMPPTY